MKKGISSVLTSLIVLIVTNIILISAITGSMGNARMVLYPQVSEDGVEVLEKTILVKNINDVPLNITLVVDSYEQGKDFIELVDSNFILNGGENKKARFRVNVKSEGEYQGRINVVFTPLNKEPGVVLSSTITVIAEKENTLDNKDGINKIVLFGFGTLALLIVLLVLLYLFKKKSVKRVKINEHKKIE